MEKRPLTAAVKKAELSGCSREGLGNHINARKKHAFCSRGFTLPLLRPALLDVTAAVSSPMAAAQRVRSPREERRA